MAQSYAISVRTVKDTPPPADPASVVALWQGEISRAQKANEKWLRVGRKIVKRYRDDQPNDGEGKKSEPHYNILYSNTETLRPALYAKPPKAVVARRYLDKDPVGRIACRVLQRSLQYQIDAGELDETLRSCVQDYLLPGRGQAWVRYYPEFEPNPAYQEENDPEDGVDDGEGEKAEEPPVLDQIKSETICVDYVNWVDFLCDPARTWDEVGWVARRVYMTKSDMSARFTEIDVETVPLNNGPDEDQRESRGSEFGAQTSEMRKASIWEIWHKAKRKIIWIAEGLDTPLDEKDDPLHLKDFFPCPRPLTATTTTNSLIPVPFYMQYKPQADEMDDLTVRIDRLVAAAQVKGVYDSSVTQLARLFSEASDNNLIPVENWMQFAQQGGLKGALDFLPIEMFVTAVKALQEARDSVKNDINEISGVADIIRGQGDPSETATGVNTKGKFASLRLRDMQNEVARFARDIIRIMSEVICGQFQPETLEEMSSAQEMEDLTVEIPAQPSPMMGHNGGPPLGSSSPSPPQMPAMAGAPMQ